MFKTTLLCLLSIFFVFSCTSVEEPASSFELSPVREILLNDIYNPYRIAIAGDGRILVLDQADNTIKIFDREGTLLTTAGGRGSGPGEFENPMSVGYGEGLFVVGESLGTFSVFSDNGSFIHSFYTIPFIGHLNADVRILPDSTIIIGGIRFETEEKSKGKILLVHNYAIDGMYRSSYFTLSEIAIELQLTGFYGSMIGIGRNNTVYDVQPMEYRIGVFKPDGETVGQFDHVPDYFRTIKEPMPKPDERTTINEWFGSFDTISGIFVANDSLLAIQLLHKGKNIIDLLQKSDGKSVSSIETEQRLSYIDREGYFYFISPLRDEPSAVIEIFELIGR